MEEMLIGVTDRTILVFIADPASTDGSGKTGLTHADFTVSYTRVETDNDVVVTDVTSSLSTLTNLTDAHADWGVKEVSSTLAPGLYRIDVADAVFASGAWQAVVYVMITTSAAVATPKSFRLVAVNALDAVRGGMTALPNAAADAAGGLPISDAGGLDLDNRMPAAAAVTNMNTVFNTDFASNYNTTAGRWKADLTHANGTAVENEDFTIASATSSTVTLPTTYSGGASLPDDDRYLYTIFQVVSGTGAGQLVLTTTAAASARQYNVLSGTMPVQLDNTSEIAVVGAWQANATLLGGDAQSLADLKDFADAGYDPSTNKVQGVVLVDLTTTATNVTTVNGLAANVITAAAIADGAIDAATFAAGAINNAAMSIDGSELTAVPWNAAWDAEVQSEVQDAIEVNHLDHLLAATYDPASKPGAADALLNELVESDSGVARYTANALEQGPSGGGGVADWTADERTALRSILGIPASGTTPADPSTGILDTIRDSVATRATQTSVDDLPTNAELAISQAAADDATLAAITALNNVSTAQVQTAAAAALTAYDPPTNAEMEARTLVAAGYATPTNITAGTITNVTGGINTAAGTITTLDALDTAQDTQHGTTQGRLPAALVSGRIDASVGAMAAGVVTEAAISTPAEATGRPAGILGMMRALFERYHNKRTRNRLTGAVTIRNDADSGNLRTESQTTAGDVDTVTEAS